jgi:carbamoyl-phosphate synthase small subunit
MHKMYLNLEDGESIEGVSFGFDGNTCGEVVFTTGMTGYPETLTDPSFAGQILIFTYPLLGNYGIPKPLYLGNHLMANFESEHIWAKGVVVSSCLETPSHYQIDKSLSTWLKEHKVPAIAHIDTRALTQKIREKGVMRGSISNNKTFSWENGALKGLVPKVSLPGEMIYKPVKSNGKRVLLIDCGVKHGIIRALLRCGYEVIRVPWNTDPVHYKGKISGIVVSNGPGDPKDCVQTIANIRKAIAAHIPFLGVCLGHQLVALATGADTYKLAYGHRGLNQPCLDVLSHKAYVTSQNHGYAVDSKTIPKGMNEWFINLNDKTNEGLINKEARIWSTQFHPEGNPGPFDTAWIFFKFLS